MSLLANNIVIYTRKMGIVPLSTVMSLFVAMVTPAASASHTSSESVDCASSSHTLASLCRSSVSQELIRSLLDHITSEVVITLLDYTQKQSRVYRVFAVSCNIAVVLYLLSLYSLSSAVSKRVLLCLLVDSRPKPASRCLATAAAEYVILLTMTLT